MLAVEKVGGGWSYSGTRGASGRNTTKQEHGGWLHTALSGCALALEHWSSWVNGAKIQPHSTHPSVHLLWASRQEDHHFLVCTEASVCAGTGPTAYSKSSCQLGIGGETRCMLRDGCMHLQGSQQVTYASWTPPFWLAKGEGRGLACLPGFLHHGTLNLCLQLLLNSLVYCKTTCKETKFIFLSVNTDILCLAVSVFIPRVLSSRQLPQCSL